IEIRGKASELECLRQYEAEGPAFPGNLASLFITSSVVLVEDGQPLSIRVSRAEGGKCERCWIQSPVVGTFPVHPGVCERCASVLEAL
ncbi:MAG TPA: hypothetical protein VN083_02710, partial [Vicinamibacteria bacterium]|nr:hypothetical protein [Vicinamibacteria bacterium]